MDAAVRAELELMVLESAYTALSVDPIYENDDGELAYNSDVITGRLEFLADVIERIEVAANAKDTATLVRLARLVDGDDAAALRKLSEMSAVRRALAPTEIARRRASRLLGGRVARSPDGDVIRARPETLKLKYVGSRASTHIAEHNEGRRDWETRSIEKSLGVTRKEAESLWLDAEMKRAHPNLWPKTPAYHKARKAMRQRRYNANKNRKRRLAQSPQ